MMSMLISRAYLIESLRASWNDIVTADGRFASSSPQAIPVYFEATPFDGKDNNITLAQVGRSNEILTQERKLEYVEFDWDVMTTTQGSALASFDRKYPHEVAEIVYGIINTDDQVEFTFQGSVYLITCDRMGGRAFPWQTGGTQFNTLADRYFMRIQAQV